MNVQHIKQGLLHYTEELRKKLTEIIMQMQCSKKYFESADHNFGLCTKNDTTQSKTLVTPA